MSLLGDKQVDLIGLGQTWCPCWGTNKLPLLGDKRVASVGDKTDSRVLNGVGGQTGCPHWGTNRLPLLRDKQVVLIGGQTGCPYWGTNRFPLLGGKQVALIGGKTGSLIGGQTGCPYWGTPHLKQWRLSENTKSIDYIFIIHLLVCLGTAHDIIVCLCWFLWLILSYMHKMKMVVHSLSLIVELRLKKWFM